MAKISKKARKVGKSGVSSQGMSSLTLKAKLMKMSVKAINVTEGWNARSSANAKPTKELIASIKKLGVLNPILVRNSNVRNGAVSVINGERRYLAAVAAGVQTIPCLHYGFLDDNTARVLSLTVDENQKPLTKKERCKGYQQLAKAGLRAGEIAEIMGVKRQTVHIYLAALKTTPRLREAVSKPRSKGGVDPKVAARASKLPKKAQEELAPKVKGKTKAEAMPEVEKAEIKAGIKRKRATVKQPKKGPRPRQPGEGKVTPIFRLAADYQDRCRDLHIAISQRLKDNPENKVLRARMDVIRVLQGKMQVTDLYPKY